MNFSQLQDRAKLLSSFEAYTDIDPAPDWPSLVNQAWAEFSWDAEIFIKFVDILSVANNADYIVPRAKVIYDVTYGGQPLTRSDEHYERYLGLGWRFVGGGPLFWAATSVGAFTLIPIPSAGGITMRVRCAALGDDMINPEDEPGSNDFLAVAIPDNLHEAIAIRAATLLMRAFAADVGQQRLADYEARYQAFVATARGQGPSLSSARIQEAS